MANVHTKIRVFGASKIFARPCADVESGRKSSNYACLPLCFPELAPRLRAVLAGAQAGNVNGRGRGHSWLLLGAMQRPPSLRCT